MRISAFGTKMENRPFSSAFTLKVIPESAMTPFELLLLRIGREELSQNVEIVGLPWVSPSIMGKSLSSLEEYLGQPIYIKRMIEVVFLAPCGVTSDLFVVGYDSQYAGLVTEARTWLDKHLDAQITPESIIWHSFDPDYSTLIPSDNIDSIDLKVIPSLLALKEKFVQVIKKGRP